MTGSTTPLPPLSSIAAQTGGAQSDVVIADDNTEPSHIQRLTRLLMEYKCKVL